MVGRVVQLVVIGVLATSCTDAAGRSDDTATAPSSTRGATPTAAASAQPDTGGERPTLGHYSTIYSDPDTWLCLPDRPDDACDIDLTTTRVDADGTRSVETPTLGDEPPIDCFYVYPTVSEIEAPNSDLSPTDAERRAVRAQAAHLQVTCRLYAPMYRQITRAALLGQVDGIPDRGLAFADVTDAWNHYLHEHNDGRGVVLIGHSQGAGHLRELITRHIDEDPQVRPLIVSAVLLGTTVRTPVDGPTGAHFQNLAPCSSATSVGCVVSWSTYAADEPPGDVGFFGAVRDTDDERAVCTHPAALDGGPAALDSILPANPLRDGDIDTPWVRYVGLAEGECVEAGRHHYLEVRYPTAPPPGAPGDLGGRLGAAWGLHLIDGQIALGDLVALVSQQARAHVAAR